MANSSEAVVIGGGFFGCMIALRLREAFARVVVLEAGARLLGRASYANQARVHNGYHYPRSSLTALRSRVNFPRFVADFEDCIDSTFEKYYAVGRTLSKVTASQFLHFFERIGAPISRAPDRVQRLFDPDQIEDVFSVVEHAFDADRLAARLEKQMAEAGVEVRYGCQVDTISPRAGGSILVDCSTEGGGVQLLASQVYNCTYSRLNGVLSGSGLPIIPLKHEVAEMALIEVPEPLRGLGITVMCGPFFSVMPFPPRELYTFSHVRYTPHESWRDDGGYDRDPYAYLDRMPKRSAFPYMLRDAVRYLPALADCRRVDSLWEVKTVLPASEADDSRPILMRKHHGIPNLHCVLGAKIDNIYDALAEVDEILRYGKVG